MIKSNEMENNSKNQGEPEVPIEPNETQFSSHARIEALENQVKELENQVKEKESKYVYLYADFDNFKKRSIKERSDLIKFGWESIARDLLQIIDNLERAIDHTPPHTDPALIQGLNLVLSQFKDTLQKQGVQTINSVKKEFDPNLHEAVGQEASELPSGVVIKEHTPGYTLHGRLLRPARVVISSGEATQEA